MEDDASLVMEQSSNTESESAAAPAINSSNSNKAATAIDTTELESKLEQAQKELQTLKDEYEEYKKEKGHNEKMLLEQLEQLKKDHQELTKANFKLTSQFEYNSERFKVLKQNMEVYKNQIAALEEKNKAYNSTIIKHEQCIMHLKDEALSGESRAVRAEVALQNVQQECRLLREAEARLLKDKQASAGSAHTQQLLLANLDMIKASLERASTEASQRVETRLDDALREQAALRRRLQEEQDNFRQLSAHLDKQAQLAQTRMEEEKQQAEQLREQLTITRQQLTAKTEQIEQLSKKINSSMMLARPISDDTNKLHIQLKEAQEEITSLKHQLTLAKDNLAQYSNIAECAEKQLKEEHEENVKYKEATDQQLADNQKLIEELKEKVQELETELSLQSNGQAETAIELKSQLAKLREQYQVCSEELATCQEELRTARSDIEALSAAVQLAEDKYAREMMLHSADLQSQAALKQELTSLTNELNEMRQLKEQAVNAYNIGKSSWEEREKLLETEKEELATRLKELDDQNSVLHDQIQALSTQLSVLHAQQADVSSNQSMDSSMNRSFNEDDKRSSEQLQQIVKYLRKEKDLAITKFEVLRAENSRLKSQFEVTEKELNEVRNALTKEREGSEISIVTAAKHSEILRKVETLNAITDSNKILRDERDSLKEKIKELQTKLTSVEDKLVPLQDKNRELSTQADITASENAALRAEATRWRQRANVLIEKANKVSPEDWRRLQAERDSLVKTLAAEREALRRTSDLANTSQADKQRLEEQLNNQASELSNLRQQVSRLSQQVIEARQVAAARTDENTKITEDLASKDVQLTDIRAKETQVRKIAKKYKTQYEELAKQLEEEKKMKDNAPTPEISADMQELYREQGRKQIQTTIDELTTQVTSCNEQIENLKKENNALKNQESEKDERTKVVLKAAKTKITELTDERNKIRRELNECKTRMEAAEQNKEDSRLTRLEKEKQDLIQEKQQEKERSQREVESLNQRINQLQRQLGLPGASKPSTSSASDKCSSEPPPTANIKPMSGATQPQHQHSATVMPWRGSDTPFASIRPMSQLRTAAVLPTSQALVSPQQQQQQQQLVHTTLEVMSSSPTSSHTDYMPATSSANIRQLAVPPCMSSARDEQPTTPAESTQDIEGPEQGGGSGGGQQGQSGNSSSSTGPIASVAAVAMVLPRVETAATAAVVGAGGSSGGGTATPTAVVEQGAVGGSSSSSTVVGQQQASSSTGNTVTTTQQAVATATHGHKRARSNTDTDTTHADDQHEKLLLPLQKRTRLHQSTATSAAAAAVPEVFQGVTESGVEVEYQVPTSSQRDQEDDVVIVLSEDEEEEEEEDEEEEEGVAEGEGEEDGDGDDGEGEGGVMEADDDAPPFEESGDGEHYEMAYEPEQELVYDDVDEMESEAAVGIERGGRDSGGEGDNNEVEVVDNSSEVPQTPPTTASQSEAISSGSEDYWALMLLVLSFMLTFIYTDKHPF